MMVFVDTSAFYALLDADDGEHPRSSAVWAELLANRDSLVTSNYALVETVALTQRRLGIEAVRLFEGDVTPLLQVIWVDAETHRRATAALLLQAGGS